MTFRCASGGLGPFGPQVSSVHAGVSDSFNLDLLLAGWCLPF